MAKKKKSPSEKKVVLPGEGESLCVVEKIIGGDHVLIRCLDDPNSVKKAKIPGKMRRRVWIREGDIVIAAIWDFQPDRADITYRYQRDELKRLLVRNLLPKEVAELAGITEEEIEATMQQGGEE